ncbi:MAG: hypothetical protein MdMp014T_0131 [Treponematales bacterium]
MKGTTKKNFGKSGRSGAVLTLAGLFIMTMALVFGFAACETEEEAKATKFEGTWTGTSVLGDEYASVCVFEKDVVKYYVFGSDYLDGDVADYRGTFEFTDTTLTFNFTEYGLVDKYYGMSSTVVQTFTYVLEGDTVTLTATGSTPAAYGGTFERRIPNAD